MEKSIIAIHAFEAFNDHLNSVDNQIQKDVRDNHLVFVDCVVHIGKNGELNIEVYRKSIHINQYLLFDSHHPLKHKLGVIQDPKHRAQTIPSEADGKKREHKHIHTACGYSQPSWSTL